MVGKMRGMETQWVFKESSVSFHILSSHNSLYHFPTIVYGMVSGSSSFPAARSLHQWYLLLKIHLPMQETKTQVRSLGGEDPLEEEKATHSSILAWESHGQSSLVGYSPAGATKSQTQLEYILLVKYIYTYIYIQISVYSLPESCQIYLKRSLFFYIYFT